VRDVFSADFDGGFGPVPADTLLFPGGFSLRPGLPVGEKPLSPAPAIAPGKVKTAKVRLVLN